MTKLPEFDIDVEEFERKPEIEGRIGTVMRFTKGRWMRVLAATDNNPKWVERRKAITEGLAQLPADLTDKQLQHFMAPHYAAALVIDWGGWKSKGGVEIPFSIEAATFVIARAWDVYEAIRRVINDNAKFRGAEIEVVVGEVGNS